MRDLKAYQDLYKDQPYERYQVQFRKRKILELLTRYKHDNLLEVGCGMSSIINDISDFKLAYIIEPGEIFYNNVVKDVSTHPKKDSISVYKDFFENWEKTPANLKIDFILISCLLHEIEDANTMLHKAYEVAGEETILHINVPNVNSFHRLLAVKMGLIKSPYEESLSQKQFQQSRIFDMEKLTDVVTTNGFKVVENGTYSFKPFTHRQMQDLIDNGFMTETMLDGFYKMEEYLPALGSEIFVNCKKAS